MGANSASPGKHGLAASPSVTIISENKVRENSVFGEIKMLKTITIALHWHVV